LNTTTLPFTRSRWLSLFLALGLLVIFVVLQVVIGLAIVIALLLLTTTGWSTAAAVRIAENGVVAGGASAVAGLLMIGLIWLVVSRAGWHPFRAPLALVPSRRWPLWVFPLLAVVVALAFDGVTVVLGRPIVPEVLLPYFRGSAAVVVMTLSTVVVAPLVEELLFRGVLFNAIERFAPAWFTVLLIALAFGVLHVLTYGDDWYTIFQAIVAGLILGGLRAWTRSLWPSILFHTTNNLYATIQAVVLVNVLQSAATVWDGGLQMAVQAMQSAIGYLS